MLSKAQFLGSVEQEINICKHLHGKLQDSHFEYRPAENMRSTLELLHYLCGCGFVPGQAVVNDDWEATSGYFERLKSISAAEVPEYLDRQLTDIKTLLDGLSEEDLRDRQVKLPWGPKMALGQALVELTLKFLVAYRMQLYIYAKQAGLGELNTHNCWLGVDPPAEA